MTQTPNYGHAARGIDAYLRTEAQSKTPLELTVMLYDGLLRFTTEARDAIVRRDIPKRHAAVTRSLAILSELQSTLNMEAGGEIAQNLDALYRFISRQLLEASMKHDPKRVDAAIAVISNLRDGWTTIASPPAAASATSLSK